MLYVAVAFSLMQIFITLFFSDDVIDHGDKTPGFKNHLIYDTSGIM